jgi:hypothetical protein
VPPSLPEVDFIEKIGRGSFGDVYKGVCCAWIASCCACGAGTLSVQLLQRVRGRALMSWLACCCFACVHTGVWCGSVVAVKVIQVRQPLLHRPMAAVTAALGPAEQTHDSAAAAAAAEAATDAHAGQVALELGQHEYESWLNANLRHPNIVQLFTSFTLGLEERRPPSLPGHHHHHHHPGALLLTDAAAGDVAAAGGHAADLSFKTHLVMEMCELGTMQVRAAALEACRCRLAASAPAHTPVRLLHGRPQPAHGLSPTHHASLHRTCCSAAYCARLRPHATPTAWRGCWPPPRSFVWPWPTFTPWTCATATSRAATCCSRLRLPPRGTRAASSPRCVFVCSGWAQVAVACVLGGAC